MKEAHWQALCRCMGWPEGKDVFVQPEEELTPRYPLAVYDGPGCRVIRVTPELAPVAEEIAALPRAWPVLRLAEEIFPGIPARTDPSCYYLLPEEVPLPETPSVRTLSPADDGAWQALLMTCTLPERLAGEISLEDPLVTGAFAPDGVLTAAASFLYWGDALADIGVLTHGGYRRQGWGALAVAALCREGRMLGKLNQYRCDDANTGSRSLCRKLGFQPTIPLTGLILTLAEE